MRTPVMARTIIERRIASPPPPGDPGSFCEIPPSALTKLHAHHEFDTREFSSILKDNSRRGRWERNPLPQDSALGQTAGDRPILDAKSFIILAWGAPAMRNICSTAWESYRVLADFYPEPDASSVPWVTGRAGIGGSSSLTERRSTSNPS